MVGCLVVLALFAVLDLHRAADRPPGRRPVPAAGRGRRSTTWLVGQAVINIGGVVGPAADHRPAAAVHLRRRQRPGGDAGRGRHARLVRPRRAGRGPGPARPSARAMGPATLGPAAAAAAPDAAPADGGRGRPARRRRRAGRRRQAGDGAARGDGDGSAAVGGAGRGRHRRAHLPAARLRRLPAPARPGRPDHLPRHAARAGERADPGRPATTCGTIPAYQLPRSVNLNLLRTPDRMWRSTRAGRRGPRRGARPTWWSASAATSRCRPTWPPGGARLPLVIHEVNVPPGVANRLGMQFTKHVAVGFPHQPQQAESLRDARVVGVPLRTVDRRRWTGRRCAPRARAHFGLRPATCRRCSSSAARRAPARSTWRWPARPRR